MSAAGSCCIFAPLRDCHGGFLQAVEDFCVEQSSRSLPLSPLAPLRQMMRCKVEPLMRSHIILRHALAVGVRGTELCTRQWCWKYCLKGAASTIRSLPFSAHV
jgi:hypothetical protein